MRHSWTMVLALGAAGGAIWACTGDAGPPGATGPAGSQGATGGTGANGSAGPTGSTGPTGPAGSAGDAGATGPAGEAGGPGPVISNGAKHGLDISPVPVNLAGKTADQIEMIGNGSYIVNAVAACGDCHNTPGGTLKFLAGGNSFPIGVNAQVTARNLTPDTTTGLKLTEAQFIEALRTGKDFLNSPDGGTAQSLIVMPWSTFRWMTTYDLKSIYAYLQAIPAVSNAIQADMKPAIPPTAFPATYNEGAVSRSLPPEYDFQNNPIPDPDNVLRGTAINALGVAAPTDPTLFGRGSYIVNAQAGCSDCHTNPDRNRMTLAINTAQFLTGGRVFATPAPLQPVLKTVRSMTANLIGAGNGYFGTVADPTISFQQWMTEITQGVHADMPPPQPPLAFPMPWQHYRYMTVGDMEAVYTYVRTLAQNANINGTNDKLTQDAARYCTQTSDCNTGAGETCNTTTSECIGKTCNVDSDCDACQTCATGGGGKHCAAPASTSACLTQGI